MIDDNKMKLKKQFPDWVNILLAEIGVIVMALTWYWMFYSK